MTEREALNMALQALETLMIERGSIYDKAITAIKEALAQPEQELVACVTYKEVADTMNGLWGGTLVQRQIAEELENTMLYTTPPQRKPLTDEEIDELRSGYQSGRIGSFVSVARAIEAAHGIKGEA